MTPAGCAFAAACAAPEDSGAYVFNYIAAKCAR